MKKLWIILGGIILLMLIGIGAYFMLNSQKEEPPVVEPSGEELLIEPGLAEKAVVKSIENKGNASAANTKIDVVYPNIQSFSNKNFQKYINDEITKVILAYQEEIKAVVDDKTATTELYTYTASYERYNHDDYLSLVISNDYETGGIRSNKWKDIYNINVKTERVLLLRDIFPPNVNYKKVIIDEINKQAKEKNYELMNGVGLYDLSENQKFYIKDEKLIIYFDPSEIAPATYGELQFEMPFVYEEGLFIPQS